MNKSYVLVSIMLLTIFLVLLPTLLNGWVDLDDDIYILENSLIRELSWQGIKKMFTTFHINGSYNPLVLISWAIDYRFVDLAPWLYHLTNLFLHLGVVLLVFYLALKLSKNQLVAFGTSLLFGIHPMHVEAVAWITARKDLLYTLFYLAGLISYCFYLEKKSPSRSNYYLVLSFLFYVFSLLSKGSAITFPLILVVLDYYYKRKKTLKLFLEKIPFVVLSIVFTYVAIQAQEAGKALHYRVFYSVLDSLSTGFYGYFVYLVKVVIPYRLSALHPYPTPSGTPNPWYYGLAALPVLAIVGYCLTKIKTNRILVFGFGFFFITLVPVIQVLSFAVSETADRFTYLPYFSLFYLLSVGYVWVVEHQPQWGSGIRAIAIVFLSFLGLKTFSYAQVWKNSETLFTHIIGYYPHYDFPYENRGAYRLGKNKLDMAMYDCQSAIEINPNSNVAHYNLGLIYDRKENPKAALKFYDTALSIDENNLKALQNRGILLTKMGRLEEALRDFNFSIKKNPNHYSFYVNRAFLFKEKKRYDLVIKDAQKAIALNEKSAEAHYIMGLGLRFLNKNQALVHLDKAIRYQPKMLFAYENRGALYYGLNAKAKALLDFNKAVELGTTKMNIYINRGVIFLNQNKLEEAIKDFSSAEKLDPRNYLVYFNRAIAYRLKGNYELALEDINTSLKLHPNHTSSRLEKQSMEKQLLEVKNAFGQ